MARIDQRSPIIRSAYAIRPPPQRNEVFGTHNGIVVRDGKDYRLATDPSSLSSKERDELVRLCDEAIRTYLQKRGTAVYVAGAPVRREHGIENVTHRPVTNDRREAR